MRQDDSCLAGALEAFEHVQQEGVVAILLGWSAVFKPAIQVVCRVQAAGPVFIGKRRVGDDEIKGLEATISVFKVRGRQGIGLPDFCRGAVVQHHVHAGQRAGGVVHLLAVQSQVQPGAVFGFVVGLEQQRTRATGGVINGLRAADCLAHIKHQRHGAGDL